MSSQLLFLRPKPLNNVCYAILAVLCYLLIYGVADSNTLAANVPFIEIDPGVSTAFRQGDSGKPFVAVGLNYFDHQTGWAPKLWQMFDEMRVRRHLAMIADQGFNTIRVFLTLESFHCQPGKVNPVGEEKFRRLLALCRELGIYLIPSGPDHWEGWPAWRGKDEYADESVLRADETWWQNFAAKFRDEPAILAWDLKNEPKILWDTPTMEIKWNDWLRQRYDNIEKIAEDWKLESQQIGSLGKIKVPLPTSALNDQRLYDYQCFREHIGDEWTRRMVAAIRRSDPKHMITIGHIQHAIPFNLANPKYYAGFNIKSNAGYLDFVTIHFYPIANPKPCTGAEGIAFNAAYFEALLYLCSVDKPLMLGEFGWYGGGEIRSQGKTILPAMPIEHQAAWCNELLAISRGRLCGWLNWAFADTPSSQDLTRFSGCWDENLQLKPWGKRFGQFARSVTAKPDKPRPFAEYMRSFNFDRKVLLTSPKTARQYLQTLADKKTP
ncbi:MAG: cellulase family glycosylhydrolase [Planctomycetota bacterium]|nr:MAG: cellulase family glycosylhydrolase [Planctomycetota bacterium]